MSQRNLGSFQKLLTHIKFARGPAKLVLTPLLCEVNAAIITVYWNITSGPRFLRLTPTIFLLPLVEKNLLLIMC